MRITKKFCIFVTLCQGAFLSPKIQFNQLAHNEVLVPRGVLLIYVDLVVIVMKSLTRFMSMVAVVLAVAMFAPQRAEAQILKKLSQGLEKVNNALDKVEKGVDDVMSGNVDGLFKSRKNKQKGNASNVAQDSAVADDEEDAAEWSEEDMEEAEVQYPIPFITEDTKYMQLPYVGSGTVSSVHEGVFAVSRDGAFSFWRVTGEKLFDFEW